MKQINRIPLKAWIMNQAEACGISVKAFEARYYRHRVPRPKLIRKNARVILVAAPAG